MGLGTISVMSDPQRRWYVDIVETWFLIVFSRSLRQLLGFADQRLDLTRDMTKACAESKRLLKMMKSDADLRYWLHEQAEIPEAIAVMRAVDLVLVQVQRSTLSTDEFATLVADLMKEPSLRRVALIGLQMLSPER